MVNDYQEGTDFGHHEERQEEKAQGEYHVVLPDGRKQVNVTIFYVSLLIKRNNYTIKWKLKHYTNFFQTVSYEADERGFKPQISYENSEDLARSSGYDSNANNVRNGGNHDGHFVKNGGHDTFGTRSNGY